MARSVARRGAPARGDGRGRPARHPTTRDADAAPGRLRRGTRCAMRCKAPASASLRFLRRLSRRDGRRVRRGARAMKAAGAELVDVADVPVARRDLRCGTDRALDRTQGRPRRLPRVDAHAGPDADARRRHRVQPSDAGRDCRSSARTCSSRRRTKGLQRPGYRGRAREGPRGSRGRKGSTACCRATELDALVAPTGGAGLGHRSSSTATTSWARRPTLPAVAGYPHITVPMGCSRLAGGPLASSAPRGPKPS